MFVRYSFFKKQIFQKLKEFCTCTTKDIYLIKSNDNPRKNSTKKYKARKRVLYFFRKKLCPKKCTNIYRMSQNDLTNVIAFV